ncbi:MAG: hypothetical protein IJA04_05855 [Bacteroidaceae bacterium]|nr:hypothetical protein [Bacteroidaceae bacterium]
MYKTVFSIGDNIKILETKNPKTGVKLPEESHTPNRTYATFYRNGKGLKEIARYGPDGKKIEEIHIVDHKGLGAHWHPWKSGGQVKNDARPLTTEMKKLVNKIINFKK